MVQSKRVSGTEQDSQWHRARVSDTEQEYSLSKAKVKHNQVRPPDVYTWKKPHTILMI